MTTSMRARWARAAASLALAGAALAVSGAPAAAAPPAIRIVSVSSDHVPSGGTVRVRFEATNNQRGNARTFVAVSGGLRCTAGCAAVRDLGPGRSATFEATLVAPQVREGEETGLNLAVSVRVGTQTAFDHRQIIVGGGGDKAPAAVRKVSGRVRDAAGEPIKGAAVGVRDSAGHEFRTTTDRGGKFSVRSSAGKPIAPGPITVVAGKEGYRTASLTVQGSAGSGTTVRLTLRALAAPATTPPSPSALPSTPAVAEPLVTEDSPAESSPAALTPAAGDDGGAGPLLFGILGGLLIVGGLAALALMVIRRRSAPEEPTAPVHAGHGGVADAPTALLPTVPRYGHDPGDGYGTR